MFYTVLYCPVIWYRYKIGLLQGGRKSDNCVNG